MFRKLSIVISILVAIAAVAFLVRRTVHARNLLPRDSVLATEGWADESKCIECHEQAEEFFETGHAKTLAKATDRHSIELLAALAQSDIGQQESVELNPVDGHPFLVCGSESHSNSSTVDWCFGSGAHARTWVRTLNDSMGATDLLELRWTWYHQTETFGITPGQPDQQGLSATGQMGLLFDGPRAIRCFACHSSRLTLKSGGIVEDQIHAGVTCQRCHGPRADHVASEGKITHTEWRGLDRNDAVARCAQCHREASEQPPEDIRPDNPDIARFQPIGLSQSACFKASEMTCTTCHDPHKPLASQDSKNIRQCTQCHDPQQTAHTTCAAGHLDGCLKCHMPVVQMDRPLGFTDHWIRVRSESTP